MEKLKNIVEQVGRRKIHEVNAARVGGVYLKKGMTVKLKNKKDMLKNHYYENHPQKYKKLINQIAGTTQEVEKISQANYNNFEANNVKLVGFDLWIEDVDIEVIVDSAGTLIIRQEHKDKLKVAIEDAVANYFSKKTTIDPRNFSRKELGNIVRDVANMIAKEGKTEKIRHS